MHARMKFSGLLVCGTVLCAPAASAQPAGGAANPYPASPATPMEAGARADIAAASPTGAPIVNPPDPHNAGTLAESARTTALATYPWSTADIWFDRR